MNSVPPAAKVGRLPAWFLPAALLLLGLLLRLGFVWRDARVAGDTLLYGDLAHNLLAHHVFGFTQNPPLPPRPTLIRLPGYPLFLAGCFAVFGTANYTAVLVLQCFADLGTCWLLARLSSALGALCPFTANYVAAPLTETLVLLMMAFAFYAFLRWRESPTVGSIWLYGLAFALAYSILLRPEQGLLAAALGPAVLWVGLHRTGTVAARVTPAILLTLLTLAPLVPWTVRNSRVFHQLQPLAPRSAADPGELVPQGFYRWFRTFGLDFASTETVYWPFNGDQINIADLPDRAFDSNAQYAATASLLDDYNRTTTVTPALDARFAALAQERIQKNPMRYFMALPVGRTLNMILRPRTELLPMPLEWWKVRAHVGASLVAIGFALLNLGYLAAAAWTWKRRRTLVLDFPAQAPLLYAMAATLVLRTLLLLTLDNSEPRYTLEFFPVLIPLAAASLARLGLVR